MLIDWFGCPNIDSLTATVQIAMVVDGNHGNHPLDYPCGNQEDDSYNSGDTLTFPVLQLIKNSTSMQETSKYLQNIATEIPEHIHAAKNLLQSSDKHVISKESEGWFKK